ncbi:hypothetical protein Anae109_3671 [Anaeromyxobacter sp. Fw109-5]|nr:hypothetical protein Anae109_3671 [Anaeromyxobacter sp. Fw109-5]
MRAASATGPPRLHQVARGVQQDGRGGRSPQTLPLAPRPLQPGLRPIDRARALLLRDPAEDADEQRALWAAAAPCASCRRRAAPLPPRGRGHRRG